MVRKVLAGLALVSSIGMAAEMVPVPGDFTLLEIPEGSQIEFKKPVVLKAGSTKVEVLLSEVKGIGSRATLKCELNYEASTQRRTIPAGTKLETVYTSVSPITQDWPATECFKANKYPLEPAQEHYLSMKSASGFNGTLHCRSRHVWTAPGEIACDYSFPVEVGMLTEAVQFHADKDKLNGIIGFF